MRTETSRDRSVRGLQRPASMRPFSNENGNGREIEETGEKASGFNEAVLE